MRLVFFCNYLNHHQVRFADALHHRLGKDFIFVATMPANANELKGGGDYSRRSYCLLASESGKNKKTAMSLAADSDVCLFGACSQEYAVHRAIANPAGLSFEIGERRLKRGLINLVSPNLLAWLKNYIFYFRNANFYKLCSSGFAAHDDRIIGCYTGKHFKWGYFTECPRINIDEVINSPNRASTVRILWVARFLQLKHPERMLQLGRTLLAEGYSDFEIIMIGNGPEFDRINSHITQSGLSPYIKLLGSLPNDEVLKWMRKSDICCFTSDRREGWGAVANEAMSRGCVLVASKSIGSTPYLIKDEFNGFAFVDNQSNSLSEKVKWLIDHPHERNEMRRNAYYTIKELWNPDNAADSLLRLIDDLRSGRDSSIKEGPCSKA